MESTRTTRARQLPLLSIAILLTLAGIGCGHSHDSGYAGSGEAPAPPLITEDHAWTIPSIDALDGFVRVDDRVETRSGLEVTQDGSIAFLSFDVTAIPYGARVTWAELLLWTEDRGSYGGPVELAVSAVDYGPSLDPQDPERPYFDSRYFVLGPAVAGASIGLDLTPLVRYEIDSGSSTLGLRLDAFGGDLLFEDGGSNLGTGAVPLLTVAYEW